jgi:membrane protease YdiL (CAAX protease family)
MVRSSGSQFRDLAGFDLLRFSLKEIWLGVRTYLSILPAFIGLLILLIAAASRFQYEPPPHPLVEVFMKEELFPAWTLGYSLVLACVVGPVVEEIFFRGFFYPALKKYWGAGWAMALTAALFAGVHENLFSFVPIFFLGLVLCYLYEQRKSLTAAISLHIVHNTAFITYFFLMKNVLLESGGALPAAGTIFFKWAGLG